MIHRHFGRGLLLAAAITVAGCENPGDGAVLGIDSAGRLGITLYIDRDGSGALEPGPDLPAPDLRVIVRGAAGDTVADLTSTAGGTATVAGLPVGEYTVAVPAELLGDSLAADAVSTRVTAEDSTHVVIPLVPPLRTIAEVREGSAGGRVVVHGVALNTWQTFGDSTVSIADSTGTIQVHAGQPSVAVGVGDSVRVWARADEMGGWVVLRDGMIFRRGDGDVPASTEISTSEAADGMPEAARWGLVRIDDAVVVDVPAGPGGVRRLMVDDGTGLLELLLDANAQIAIDAPLVAGLMVDATGILLPIPAGGWRLKPRATADVDARVPGATLAEIRGATPGSLVEVSGVALNGAATFGDASVHLADSTGALRVLQVTGSPIFTGDSVRIVGRVAVREGQNVVVGLGGVPAIILSRGATPSPVELTTAGASTAVDGRWDAMLVRVDSAVVQDTATIGGEMRLTIDDGSGPVVVLIDGDTGIRSSGFVPGVELEVTGLLVPASEESWLLKPRVAADVVAP